MSEILVKRCPNCQAERPLTELWCGNVVDGKSCGWNLAGVTPTLLGTLAPAPQHVPSSPPEAVDASCPNGHPVTTGDYLCPTCGELVEPSSPGFEEGTQQPYDEGSEVKAPTGREVTGRALSLGTVIDGWMVIEHLGGRSGVEESYLARRVDDGREAVLRLYAPGAEPDADVYDALRRTDVDHVPEILAFGRYDSRAFEVSERIQGGDLHGVDIAVGGQQRLRVIVDEIGRALESFAQMGLRHRDLRPEAILVRNPNTLDLVITDFSSARLSEYDLDLVSPLESTRYMAPEAVLGGVSAASDWWSLGMILLEKLTSGTCFVGVNERAFLIHAMTHGVSLPENLDSDVRLLLRGLLARERAQRWRWREVKAWLDGESPPVPGELPAAAEQVGPSIELGGKAHRSLSNYALAAADAEHWSEAREQFLRGRLIVWAEEAGLEPKRLAALRRLASREINDDLRLSIALKTLNPDMPLILRGDIVTPGWLTQHPEEGYALISSDAPDVLAQLGAEPWLGGLKKRETAVRARAKHHDVELFEPDLRAYLLASSRANLAALWEERRRLHPDTDHRGLSALIDRPQVTDEDLIILLSAAIAQFRTVDDIVVEAEREASAASATGFDPDAAREMLCSHRRREIFARLADRIADFAQCGLSRIDAWADQFRHDNRISLSRALVILSLPENAWRRPARQDYVRDLIAFFEQKVALSIRRGPLARMTIGRTSARIDLADLGTRRQPADAMLNQIIDRSVRAMELDPAAFAEDPELEARLRRLVQQSQAYKRDTGIDGLYIGFPFVLFSAVDGALPRIAPVLLWPVRVTSDASWRGAIKLSFDDEREEIRLNPALEAYISVQDAAKWREAADEARRRAGARVGDIMDEFGSLADISARELEALPGKDIKLARGEYRLCCSAVLFHAVFVAQAVMEDLRALKNSSPRDTALEKMLRLPADGERIEKEQSGAPLREGDRYFTASSDPSQEEAVLEARSGRGLVIEGPPGTGKSQTIVNIVGDAIGRKKSLLLVCQKQAALDVVRKRLEAEGLGHRMVMITDINKDRRTVIREVRDQVEALLRQPPQLANLNRSRAQLAARIEALETDLNRHHEALHLSDEETGLGYRDLISELVALEEGPTPPLDCIEVRALVGELDRALLETLKEACAPLGEDWLAADYEGSALSALEPFAWDPSTLRRFERAWSTYVAAERLRAEDLVAQGAPYSLGEITDGELEDWIAASHRATAKVSFLGKLSIGRFKRRLQLRARLREHNTEPSDTSMEGFKVAAQTERAKRAAHSEHRRSSDAALVGLVGLFSPAWLEVARERVGQCTASSAAIAAIDLQLPTLAAYQRFRARAKALPEEAFALFAALRSVASALAAIPREHLDAEIRRLIDREARLAWLGRVEAARPELLMDHRQLASKVTALAEADQAMRQRNRENLRFDVDVRRLGSIGRWSDITRLQGPRSRSLRQFVEAGVAIGLFEARPIWLMNPDVACRLLPRERALFDVVVFDEASQMPVEYALPALFRGGTAVVSGDEKQLPPTSFFSSRVESDEAEILDGAEPSEDATEEELEAAEENWNRREIKDCSDLLALARAVLPQRMLEVHYRSQYRELIAYSNTAFYQSRLNVPVKHPEDEIRRVRPIEVVRVDGLYADQTNRDEAERVVELLAESWRVANCPSIGVVTFNRKQADLIEDCLAARAGEDPDFQSAYTRELARNEGGEDVGFFVKNVENVQGDERDEIIFSTTFGSNAQGSFRRFFGVLGQKGGERRLNVAVSRAKRKVTLVTSMPVDLVSDLIASRRAPRIPRDYLQGYLYFAEQVSAGDLETAEAVLRQVGGRRGRAAIETGTGGIQGFSATVAEYLRQLGYEPTQVADGGAFSVDFAIPHPKTGLFGIGIECDAPSHPILAQARAREVWRPALLSKSLPRLHRVSCYGWYYDRESEQGRLADAVKDALS